MPLSYNVFYIYCDLKREDSLPQDINSFADYLRKYFELEEKKLNEQKFINYVFGIASRN